MVKQAKIEIPNNMKRFAGISYLKKAVFKKFLKDSN